MGANPQFIINLSQTYKEDEDLVGKKVRELGTLSALGIPIPKGFVITTKFFNEFLILTGIDKEIKRARALAHPALSDSHDKLFFPVQRRIMQSYMPENLTVQLHEFYRKHSGVFKNSSFNVFSSSTSNKSIMYADVSGDANLIFKIKTIWSLSMEEPIAIVVQENIKSEIKGMIVTDKPIINNKLAKNHTEKLIKYCNIIKKHFYFPYEIEYVVFKDKLFVTNMRAYTGTVNKTIKIITNNNLRKLLIKGTSINPGIVTGKIKILQNINSKTEAKKGEVIVLNYLNHSLFGRIKNAKAVVVDSILLNSIDKALYRKGFRIPTIEGTINASKIFQNGNIVTVNGMNGEIYSGGLIY